MEAVPGTRVSSCQRSRRLHRESNKAELSLTGQQDLKGQVTGIQKGAGTGVRHRGIWLLKGPQDQGSSFELDHKPLINCRRSKPPSAAVRDNEMMDRKFSEEGIAESFHSFLSRRQHPGAEV